MNNLSDLIRETIAVAGEGGNRADTMLTLLRQNHFWPAMQTKKFFDNSGLVLLHNTYKRMDVESFQELYDECRSVVLDLAAPEGENVVVSLAHSIPERMTSEHYKLKMQDSDVCEMAHEGTVVTVYEHNGRWYFGTTSCPSVDRSRFAHPTKTHGQMLDDILAQMFSSVEGGSEALRDAFTAKLDAHKSYAFVLVHADNKHVMDCDTNALYHISTRDRETLSEEDLSSQPLASIGIKYPTRFATPSEALASLDDPTVYGVIVKPVDGKVYKVSAEAVVTREECNLGNSNKWVNMLSVYMQTKPHYKVNDYIREYAPDLEYPKDDYGYELAPTYIIHTVMCTMRDILHYWYKRTTTFYPDFCRFRMDKNVDASLPPILRFHLAQLRHIQVNQHSHAYINHRAVYDYLCHHQTMKNIRNLIAFFATSVGENLTHREAQCFAVLHQMLTE